MKEPFFGIPHSFLNHLLTLSLRMTPFGVFLDYFSFDLFIGHFLLFTENKTKFIRFYTKFHVTPVKFLPSKCTSLLLHSKSVQGNCLLYLKN